MLCAQNYGLICLICWPGFMYYWLTDLVEKIVSYQRLSLTKDPTNPRMKLKNNYYYYDCDPSYPQVYFLLHEKNV